MIPARAAQRAVSTENPPQQVSQSGALTAAYWLLLLQLIFNQLSLPAAHPWLGAIRPTLVLTGLIGVLVLAGTSGSRGVRANGAELPPPAASRWLKLLIGVAVIAVPIAEWPGSALRIGIPQLLRVALMFWFIQATVTTRKRLYGLVALFIVLETVRVASPVYLNATTGYWGDVASMTGGEFMNRLSGAPWDIVNPNGLAFVAVSTVPFWHYLLLSRNSWLARLLYAGALSLLLYALVLTGSRSGMVALAVVVGLIVWKSRYRVTASVLVFVVGALVLGGLNDNLRDRYLSLVSDDTKNAATKSGRINGIVEDFELGLRRPIGGHGMGTSGEANYHYRGSYLLSHDLYTEALIELGVFGLIFLIGFLVTNLRAAGTLERELSRRRDAGQTDAQATADWALARALSTWWIMFVIFSVAQYGLREPYMYLMGGVVAALLKLVGPSDAQPPQSQPQGRRPLRRSLLFKPARPAARALRPERAERRVCAE